MTKLENYQRLHWDVFYKNNQNNFYKDRHYIRFEFVDLKVLEDQRDKEFVLLDYGCGVGNGFFPIIETFGLSNLTVHGVDISKTAIGLIKKHELFDEERVKVF